MVLLAACGGDSDAEGDATSATGATSTMSASVTSPSMVDDADSTAAADDGGPSGQADSDGSGDATTMSTISGATLTEGETTAETTEGETAAGEGCEAGDYIVCEDFEGAALGGYPDGWGLRASGVWGGNTIGTTDEDAVRGQQSLRIGSGTTGAQWLNYMGDISELADGHWGRMYLRMGTPIPWPGGGVIHADVFEARGNWEGSTHQVRWAAIENSGMQHNWGYNVQTSNAGEFIHETSYIYDWPQDWMCLEWHHDQAAQTATLWVDGEEVLAVTAGQDPQLPTFDDISVGWANYQPADPEFVVYLDEVVLDDSRVGCLQ